MERIRFILGCPNTGNGGESLRPKRFDSAIVDEAEGFDDREAKLDALQQAVGLISRAAETIRESAEDFNKTFGGFDDIEDAEICTMGAEELDEWIFKGPSFEIFATEESREIFNLSKENTRKDIAKPNRLTQLDE